MLVFFLLVLYLLTYIQPLLAVVQPLIWPILVSILIAYLLHPLIEKAVHSGMNRSVATALLFLFFILVVAALLFLGIPIVVRQVQEAMVVLPQHIGSIKAMLLTYQEKNGGFTGSLTRACRRLVRKSRTIYSKRVRSARILYFDGNTIQRIMDCGSISCLLFVKRFYSITTSRFLCNTEKMANHDTPLFKRRG